MRSDTWEFWDARNWNFVCQRDEERTNFQWAQVIIQSTLFARNSDISEWHAHRPYCTCSLHMPSSISFACLRLSTLFSSDDSWFQPRKHGSKMIWHYVSDSHGWMRMNKVITRQYKSWASYQVSVKNEAAGLVHIVFRNFLSNTCRTENPGHCLGVYVTVT